jgi:hypothetical protein
MKKTWLFLDCEAMDNVYSFTIREMTDALKDMGDSSVIFKLYNKGALIPEARLKQAVDKVRPDYIVWSHGDGWEYFDLLKKHKSSKINLWYDDPMQRLQQRPGVVRAMANSGFEDFSIFVWDRYWANQLEQITGVTIIPTELASDPKVYFPARRKLSDDAVFIGCLQSPNWIYNEISQLPGMFQVFMSKCLEVMKGCVVIPPWDKLMAMAESVMDKGDLQIFDQQSKEMGSILRKCYALLWAASKNEARVRLLRAATKVTPVLMFSETKQRNHANPYEIQGMVGEFDPQRLRIIDTSKTKGECLGQLYHYGRIHLQAVDPQSVFGGIPYRNYQTAASGRPLFTDTRIDWHQSFNSDELISYEWGQCLEDQLSEAMKRTDLDEIGMKARKGFEEKHTWQIRMQRIKDIADSSLLSSTFHRKASSQSVTIDPNQAMQNLLSQIDMSVDKNYKAPPLPKI